MGVGARPQMVRESGGEAPRALGAAHVYVEAWLNLQAAKLAYGDRRSLARCEHEGVCSRLVIHHHGLHNVDL